MSLRFDSSLNKILLLLILFSTIEMNESRFAWDFGSYCLNYCAQIKYKLAAISICSCHWISSNHRRSTINTISNINNDDPLNIKTLLIK
ncbi:unnamed protein product [Rotaria sordida]|uniref:Uncharacterized protein n=1 Tax=Rotaria sordida TaxID=392033 RepID=A0A815Y1K5_9BILA|nr:unnamed protein product [Rotaria sordida]CAF1287476.1 unnamed protein product [Rotaria sordida]CAF1564382.1 unnamed protein product [Rotaria sordida]CAF1564562.1 unnamed protein product [Rotaria sordida]